MKVLYFENVKTGAKKDKSVIRKLVKRLPAQKIARLVKTKPELFTMLIKD